MSDYEHDTNSEAIDGQDGDHNANSNQAIGSERVTSIVKWFNNSKGFGFIVPPEGESDDIFVHYRSIIGDGFKTLTEGSKVSFIITRSEKGLQAGEVSVLSD